MLGRESAAASMDPFRGKYRSLRNFHEQQKPITVGDPPPKFVHVEGAFQAMKCAPLGKAAGLVAYRPVRPSVLAAASDGG